MNSRRGLLLLGLVATLLGCRDERLMEAACRDDSQCETGLLCEDFECVPAETKSCEVVIDGNPILQPDPYSLDFGSLETPTAEQTLRIHNIGNCTLTLFEASLSSEASPFSCELCTSSFPIEIFPGRSKTFQVGFQAQAVGAFEEEIRILSDDREFAELRVPLRANFIGVPALRVTPNPIDFGFVAEGRGGKRTLQITNQGSGTAPLEVQSVQLLPEGSEHFSFTTPFAGPVTLAPVTTNLDAIITLEVQFHPRAALLHTAEIVVATNHGEVRVPVHGNAETPPAIQVAPESIDLGEVPLGTTNVAPVTLINGGGAPLEVAYEWGGPTPTTDLFALPAVLAKIPAGKYVELQVALTATALGPINGLLILHTNDPSRPTITIPVSGVGVAGPGGEVVKIEMTYDNGADTTWDSDLRNVDMTLEHPYGYVCNEEFPSPTNWGSYGQPSWIGFGPKREPERIVLADVTQDGNYRVMVQYREDCSSLPSAVTAGLLGISADLLLQYLTGGVGDLDSGELADAIAQTCVNHDPSNVTVRVFVNGTVIQEKTVVLTAKGESSYVITLTRSGGTFSAQ